MTENDLGRIAKFMGHELHVHRDYYKLQDSTFDVTKMATVLEAMEKGKVNAGVTPNFDDFVKEYSGEVDSDISEDEDDEEDTTATGSPRFSKEVVNRMWKEFASFIADSKKPKVKDCEEFATRLSNECSGEEFTPQDIRDRVWIIIRQEKKKSKTAEKRAKKKAPKRKKSKEEEDEEYEPQPSTSFDSTTAKKKKRTKRT